MLVTELAKGEKDTQSQVFGPSIAFVTGGTGKMTVKGETTELKRGGIFFIAQGVDVELEGTDELRFYRAFAE